MRQSDCPAELKILVADMLTAHDNYLHGRELLFTATTKEDIHKYTSVIVENYLDNRGIWDELNHYKQNGQILGRHPIFARLQRIDKIRGMKIGDLVNLKIRLDNNLVRNRAALRRQPDHPETSRRKERIREMEIESSEVNRMLNL